MNDNLAGEYIDGEGSTQNAGAANQRKIVIGRYHDGQAKTNWGGRATSLALANGICQIPGAGLSGVINGTYLTSTFGDFSTRDKLRMRAQYAYDIIGSGGSGHLRSRPFSEISVYADKFLARKKSKVGAALVRSIEASDELWMNGEGDLIAGYSGSLWRCLMIMRIAQSIGVPTRLVNSILSAPRGDGNPVPEVIAGIEEVLQGCVSVSYRDPESLDLSNKWFSDLRANWFPDALFLWAKSPDQSDNDWYGPDSEGLSPEVQTLFSSNRSVVAISGTSSVRERTDVREANLRLIFRNLRLAGLSPICVATSGEDAWMLPVANADEVPTVEAKTGLAPARRLMSHVRAFGSGRYHPSILASGVGTPCAYIGSNSHKTHSLQRILGVERPIVFDAFDSEQGAIEFTKNLIVLAGADSKSRASIKSKSVECGDTFIKGMSGLGARNGND